MSLLDLTPQERFVQERDLPKIWDNGFHPERINWYTQLMIDARVDGLFMPETDIPEFIAAMICEAALVNATFGDADKSPNGHFGVGWCQFDTQYHIKDLEFLLNVRRDPLFSLVYISQTPDLCKHGAVESHFNEQRWHAWKQEIIDPKTGWSALRAATEAYKLLAP